MHKDGKKVSYIIFCIGREINIIVRKNGKQINRAEEFCILGSLKIWRVWNLGSLAISRVYNFGDLELLEIWHLCKFNILEFLLFRGLQNLVNLAFLRTWIFVETSIYGNFIISENSIFWGVRNFLELEILHLVEYNWLLLLAVYSIYIESYIQ